MASVLILGAGVMGSALAVPAADNGHQVRLAATPADAGVLQALRSDRAAHPKLGAPLPEAIEPVDAADLTGEDGRADLVVVAVASPGIEWAADVLARIAPQHALALVTKGLVAADDRPLTYPEALPEMVAERGGRLPALVGIGGPCIARELAERQPTGVVYASRDRAAAETARGLLQTAYYRVATSEDAVGIEACAALKNFFAIGVSAMLGRYRRGDEAAKNPVAAAFSQAVDEMALLAAWLGGSRAAAYGLAGVGDLHVTVGGGRNSRLGRRLGEGRTLEATMAGPLAGETVEGVDVGRVLKPALERAFASGALAWERLPLTVALIACIESGGVLGYDVANHQQGSVG